MASVGVNVRRHRGEVVPLDPRRPSFDGFENQAATLTMQKLDQLASGDDAIFGQSHVDRFAALALLGLGALPEAQVDTVEIGMATASVIEGIM